MQAFFIIFMLLFVPKLLDELVESADYVDALSDEEQHKILGMESIFMNVM